MERMRLSQARHKKHWTLEEASERVGVDVNTLHKWEKGKAIPRAYNLQRLCEVYGCSAEALGLEVEMQQSSAVLSPESTRTTSDLLPFFNSDPTMRLLRLARTSRPYREMQCEFNAILEDTAMNTDPMSRRDAICRLALFPLVAWNLSPRFVNASHAAEDILPGCKAGVIACWELFKGKELSAVAGAISSYIPTLKHIATTASSTRNRKEAAELLIQCLLLKAMLAWHLESTQDAILYTQEIEQYSQLADSPMFQVLALRTQAAAYYNANHWKQALSAAEQAKNVLETAPGSLIPPVVRSYVHAGLATYQSRNGQKQEALRSLGKAHTAFFAQPPDEPAPIWIAHSKANLILHDGMAHLHVGMQKEALDSFAQIHQTSSAHEIIRVESFINQVMAEVNRADGLRDMEWCIDRWIQGIEGAKQLRSEQRFGEAITAYAAMRAVWPGERRIKELQAYITHW
ncbi:MAG TPA: helix-turn-helix transcriptional regulator [Ktedonobacteraceae bacterium]|nr:helix-turn-helix transcriptional regulator [Ktedonobacteraceae bacterium]